jgi:SsrA-binding protein
MEIERQVADVQASLADLSGTAVRATRSIAELNQRLLARSSEYRKEVETQLAEVSREVQADAEKFAAQKQDLERIDIRSPAAGHVMGLAVQTVGAVVQPGQKLMDVVPQEQDLLLEAHIAPYKNATAGTGHAPFRPRKLLMRKREIEKFAARADESGMSLIPLDVHFSRGFVKVKLGVGKGRKLHDKRQKLKSDDARREIQQAMKRR